MEGNLFNSVRDVYQKSYVKQPVLASARRPRGEIRCSRKKVETNPAIICRSDNYPCMKIQEKKQEKYTNS